MKDRYMWGFISYRKTGLLHRWSLGETPLRWVASCGLWFSYEKNNDPTPNFTTVGTKCKKCRKEQERVDKILGGGAIRDFFEESKC